MPSPEEKLQFVPYLTRRAKAHDLDEMFQCFCTTMRPHVEPAFGWNEEFQRMGFASKFGGAECVVLSVDSAFAGFTWLEHGDEWFLRLICIQPEFQNRGIGSRCVRSLQEEALRAEKRVRLKVFKTNRVRQMYEQRGFYLVGEDQHVYELIFDGACRETSSSASKV